MNIEYYILPEFWMPALVNDDLSGMTSDDCDALQSFMGAESKNTEFFQCLGPIDECDDDDKGFMRCHHARSHGVGSCEAVTVAFDVKRTDNDKSSK